MKKVRYLISLLLVVTLLLCACGNTADKTSKEENMITDEENRTDNEGTEENNVEKPEPGILICGEFHSNAKYIEMELERWCELYSKGVRHMFIEYSYANAQYLNEWMHAEDDEILNKLFKNSEGTAGSSPEMRVFYNRIKTEYPETIFHGTDIEHQYETTGPEYLCKLRLEGKEDSEEYRICSERIRQGKEAHDYSDDAHFHACREKYMVQNFIDEYEGLTGEFIMGIYGAAHTDPEQMAIGGLCDSMAKVLKEKYGELMQFEYMWQTEPIRTDKITVAGKEYEATYFGSDNPGAWGSKCVSWESWRLENAYDDFKDKTIVRALEYVYFRTKIEIGQVFMFRITYLDGKIEEYYYRSDEDNIYDGRRCMVQFEVGE